VPPVRQRFSLAGCPRGKPFPLGGGAPSGGREHTTGHDSGAQIVGSDVHGSRGYTALLGQPSWQPDGPLAEDLNGVLLLAEATAAARLLAEASAAAQAARVETDAVASVGTAGGGSGNHGGSGGGGGGHGGDTAEAIMSGDINGISDGIISSSNMSGDISRDGSGGANLSDLTPPPPAPRPR